MIKTKKYTQTDFNWANWTEEEIKNAAKSVIENRKKTIQNIKDLVTADRNFVNIFVYLDKSFAYGSRIKKALDVLSVASPDKKIREVSHKEIDMIGEKTMDLFSDKELYSILKSYNPKKEKLTPDDTKLINDFLIFFEKFGLNLPEKKQTLLKKEMQKLQKLETKFEKNITNYEDYILVTKEDLHELPVQYTEGLEKVGNKYKVTLTYPDLFPFLENVSDGDLRKKISDKNSKKGGKRNLKLLEEILVTRKNIAKIYGQPNHASKKLEQRMAKNPKTAINFINDLLIKLKPKTKNEVEILKNLKKEFTGNKDAVLFSYDTAFYINKDMKEKFNIDQQKIKEFFPTEHVKKTTFEMFSKLLDVKIKPFEVKLWHKDVDSYQIEDTKGNVLGYFSLDLYPRKGKFGHAAVFDIFSSHEHQNEFHAPYNAMICNFPSPQKNTPSLLSHDEVLTFLHEFGHILHGTLSHTKHDSLSSFNVKWDFVELPSQMCENWGWNEAFIKKLSKHYKTGKSLPKETIDQLISSKKHMASYYATRQLSMAYYDMIIHTNGTKKPLEEFFAENSRKFVNIEPSKTSLMPAGWGHMSGYDAGYYSYMWALVYAYDAFSIFEKNGIYNKETGKKFKKEILEIGASRDENISLQKFLGRKPSNKAFLKSLGL